MISVSWMVDCRGQIHNFHMSTFICDVRVFILWVDSTNRKKKMEEPEMLSGKMPSDSNENVSLNIFMLSLYYSINRGLLKYTGYFYLFKNCFIYFGSLNTTVCFVYLDTKRKLLLYGSCHETNASQVIIRLWHKRNHHSLHHHHHHHYHHPCVRIAWVSLTLSVLFVYIDYCS